MTRIPPLTYVTVPVSAADSIVALVGDACARAV
jgi:hypothetical protein